jgi:ribosome-binding protein aMBF1 (putative translation factor)
MNKRKTAYQRIQLDGKRYVLLEEDEFLSLTQHHPTPGSVDVLDALTVSDQRLADRLLQRRQDAGLTQKGLAQRAGIRVETLNRFEKGRTTPDFKTIRKLVNAINDYLNEQEAGDE